MTNKVTDRVHTALEGQIKSTLGSSWSELDYVYDIPKNAFKKSTRRYGAIPGAVSIDLDFADQCPAKEHSYQIVVTKEYKNKGTNDAPQRDIVIELYEHMNDLADALNLSKLGITDVISTTLEGFEQPEFLEEDKVCILRGNFLIKYI